MNKDIEKVISVLNRLIAISEWASDEWLCKKIEEHAWCLQYKNALIGNSKNNTTETEEKVVDATGAEFVPAIYVREHTNLPVARSLSPWLDWKFDNIHTEIKNVLANPDDEMNNYYGGCIGNWKPKLSYNNSEIWMLVHMKREDNMNYYNLLLANTFYGMKAILETGVFHRKMESLRTGEKVIYKEKGK